MDALELVAEDSDGETKGENPTGKERMLNNMKLLPCLQGLSHPP